MSDSDERINALVMEIEELAAARERYQRLVAYCDTALALDPHSLEFKDWFQGLAAELNEAEEPRKRTANFFAAMEELAQHWETVVQPPDDGVLFNMLVGRVMELWPVFRHGYDEASVELEKFRRYIVRARRVSTDDEAKALQESLSGEGFFDPMRGH